MGSLGSSPKIKPTPQQVVYVPATQTPQVETPSVVKSRSETEGEERVKNLLSRSRGRLGTIATSFRGFLGETTANARKTLLGE